MLFKSDGNISKKDLMKLCEVHYMTTGYRIWFLSADGFEIVSDQNPSQPYLNYWKIQFDAVMKHHEMYSGKSNLWTLKFGEKSLFYPIYFRGLLKGLLILGPFKIPMVEDAILKRLSPEVNEVEAVTAYLEALPIMHAFQYQSYMLSLQLYASNNTVMSNALFQDAPPPDYAKLKLKQLNQTQKIRHHKLKDETQMFEALLKNPAAIDISVFNGFDSFLFPPLANDPIRSEKNRIIGANALFCREAIRLGADSEVAFNLSDQLVFNIESLSSMREVLNYFSSIMIPAYANAVEEQRKSKQLHPIIKAIVSEVDQAHDTLPTLQDMAEKYGLSVPYLSQLFSVEMNCGFSDYVTRIKMEKAKALLRDSPLSTLEIADLLGYRYANYFSKRFKELMGMSPKAYRDFMKSE